MMKLVAVAGQFLFDYKVVNSALKNEILIDLSIKRDVRKLPQSFFQFEVGPSHNESAGFMGPFDKNPRCPLFQRKVGKFGVTIDISFINDGIY